MNELIYLYRSPLQKPAIGIMLNRNHPLAQGLIGCWLINEGSGALIRNYVDANQYGSHGVLSTTMRSGGMTSGWGTSNKFDKVLNFDGIDDYVSMPGFVHGLGSGNFTVSIWFLANSIVGSSSVFQMGMNGTIGYCALLAYFNAGNLYFYASSDSVTWNIVSASLIFTPSINTWYNVVIRRTGSLFESFYNLVPGGTGSSSLALYPGSDINLGRFQYSTMYYHNGAESSCMIYKRSLSNTELDILYRQPYCMFNYDNTQFYRTSIPYIPKMSYL